MTKERNPRIKTKYIITLGVQHMEFDPQTGEEDYFAEIPPTNVGIVDGLVPATIIFYKLKKIVEAIFDVTRS